MIALSSRVIGQCSSFHFMRQLILWLCAWLTLSANAGTPPNIIVILADDLGYGDISSFGATTIDTPHIDALARGGLKFTQFYSAAPVCTPSRAGLLTGRHPARMGIQHVFLYDSPDGMAPSEITIAEQLKQAGYHTGIVGKWHLGHQDRYMPWNQGFDEFYGVPFSNDMANFFFYENQEILYEAIDQRYLTRRYTQRAVDYIERHAGQPFFLYLAHSMPHVPLYVSPKFEGSSKRGLYGDVVQELDWSTGQIVAKLKELELLDNTLIVFSSDNGPWLAMGDHGGSAGLLRDGKGTSFEGGQRVPTIAYWPAQISAGRTEEAVASLLDLMPTFSALAGVPLPQDRIIDGNNIAAVFTDQSGRSDNDFYYASANSTNIVGYRTGNWKLKLPRSGYPKFLEPILKLDRYSHGLLLFDLMEDPGEQSNVVDANAQRVTRMQQKIANFQTRIDAEHTRKRYMRSTNADRKGYGPLMIKAVIFFLVSILFVIFLLMRIFRLIKNKYNAR